MKLNYLLLSFTILLCITQSCKTTSKSAGTSSSKKGLSEDQQIQERFLYFNAVKEHLLGNNDKAAELFAQVLRTDGRNHAAMYELASIYSEQKKYNDALFFVKSAAELSPDNEWYQLLLADTYEKTNKPAEAGAVYDKLIHLHPERVDYYFSKADALLFQGKAADAIKVYDQIEDRIGINRDITQQKERLYLKLGKTDKAAEEVEKLIKSDTANIESYAMLLELYSANGLNDKALETINRMKAIDPENPRVTLALAEYYRSTGDKAKSFEQLKKAFQSTQLTSDIKISIISSYLPLVQNDSIMLDQALQLSKILAEVHPDEANTHAVRGDFLSIARKFEEARIEYRASLEHDNKNMQAWTQLMIIESELRDFVAMEKESEEALTIFPDQSVIYLFNGTAKIQNNKNEDAARTLLSGSKLVVDNNAQLVQFYSNLGDVYNKLKNYPESDKFFDKALTVDPNEPTVLNNFAYYLSVRNEQLDKAETMSKKSNELVANSASYQDTYAWILFRQAKYNDAKTWLEKAMQSGGDKNGTILEHYGDVLFKLGEIDKAVNYWNQAKVTGDHTDLIDKKIADKKLYE